ncbi:hypothetical protein [uncultured Tenacibaculum sp.]|uniref:hypothetical protein n=1 Tax=uncultured Tenacibaculum sp. TaxID=174713 RepID=UPI002621C9B3|nr:hypothetical protein [uncultured Tenacibaculum sp.]
MTNFYDRMPDQDDDRTVDTEDFEEAVRDNINVNQEVTPQEERFREDTVLRKNLATAFTILISFWLVAVLLILTGNNNIYGLSDGILKTLLITTTANVIGMMMIILKNLFPNQDSKKQSDN